jgi:hypothetical protein
MDFSIVFALGDYVFDYYGGFDVLCWRVDSLDFSGAYVFNY